MGRKIKTVTHKRPSTSEPPFFCSGIFVIYCQDKNMEDEFIPFSSNSDTLSRNSGPDYPFKDEFLFYPQFTQKKTRTTNWDFFFFRQHHDSFLYFSFAWVDLKKENNSLSVVHNLIVLRKT